MIPRYIILVGEGRFRVVERQSKSPKSSPSWIEAAQETAPVGGGSYTERETDQAGRFPGNMGRGGMSIDERLPMQQEEHRRAVAWAAGCIENFMTPRAGDGWVFAAGPALHNPVLEALRPSLRETLAESVQKNLIHVSRTELATYFARDGAGK